MTSVEPNVPESSWLRRSLIDNAPFVAVIVLGLVGISWTSLAPASAARYWVIVTPIVAIVCIVAGWSRAPSGARVGMAVSQVLQWAGVLIAMYLVTVSDVQRSLNANAIGLMVLTLIGLGVYVSGLALKVWKLCVTGAFLALAVPVIAWIQDAALLLVLIGVALIVALFGYWWARDRISLGA